MPNILMISFDDLNDWSSVLGGYGGTVHTPNLERLAAVSATFTNAFAAAPVCNPARSAVLTGISPISSGIFNNDQLVFDVVDPSRTLPGQLQAAGFTTVTSGKVFHDLPANIAPRIYDDVLLTSGLAGSGDVRPENVNYTMTTLEAGIYVGDEAELYDVRNATAVSDFLAGYDPRANGPDLFLSVGFSRPHVPWVVPQRYFDLYPLEDIVVTTTAFDDFADIPGFADYFATKEVFDAVVAAGELPLFIQAYLACVSYADDMLGRVLDALEASAIADDTVVVLWSDHGFHPGEKSSIGKFTLWEQAARAQLMIHDPASPQSAGQRFDDVVSMQDLYATVLDYAGAPLPEWAESESLRTLIETGADPTLRGYAVTGIVGSHSIRTETWRYTRYEDGSEELYNEALDPKEYVNLAEDADAAAVLQEMRDLLAAYIDTTAAIQNLDAATPTRLVALDGESVLVAGTANDTLTGTAGDTLYIVRAGTVTVEERPGGGDDTIVTSGSFRLPTQVENLRYLGITAPEDFRPVLTGNNLGNLIEIVGGAGIADGDNGRDRINGGGGDDLLRGGAGNDTVDGGDGADTLDGGAGNDSTRGAKGDDVFRLSNGNDTIAEAQNQGFDVIDLAPWGGFAGVDIDFVVTAAGRLSGLVLTQLGGSARATADAVGGVLSIEALRDGATTRLLGAGAYAGGDGAEVLQGSAAADTLSGGGGDDRVEGGTGNDQLAGGDGRDTLSGGDGADWLTGGIGADLLTGGAGADLFAFGIADLGAIDRITDFAVGDLIDLTSIDTDPTTPDRDRVRFRADVVVTQGAAETRVDVAIGDGETLTLVLDARIALTAQNFLL